MELAHPPCIVIRVVLLLSEDQLVERKLYGLARHLTFQEPVESFADSTHGSQLLIINKMLRMLRPNVSLNKYRQQGVDSDVHSCKHRRRGANKPNQGMFGRAVERNTVRRINAQTAGCNSYFAAWRQILGEEVSGEVNALNDSVEVDV